MAVDFKSLQGQYGGASTQAIADPSDPDIITSRDEGPIDRDDEYLYVNGRPQRPLKPVTRKMSDVSLDLFRKKDPNELQELQERLFRGGFYGQLRRNQISWRTPDEATQSAFTTALQRAASFAAAGEDKTLDEVINDALSTSAQGDSGIQLTDRAEISAAVQAIAPRVFGKRADEATEEALIEAFHTFQVQKQANGDGEAPSSTWMEEQLRALNPESAEAFQGATNVQSFLKMVDPQGAFSAYRQ